MEGLPDEYRPIVDGTLAVAIGLLVTEWSGAQWFLVSMLSDLMIGKETDTDDALHAAVIIGMDARPLMGLVRTLASARLGDAIGVEVGKILDKMEKAKELRDLISHCIWLPRENGKPMRAANMRAVGKFKEIIRPVTEAEIFEKITLLQESALALLGYMHAKGMMRRFEPSQGRPY